MTSSKRSSQRQHELEIEKQMLLRELETQELEEEHRKQVAASALEEIELMTKP